MTARNDITGDAIQTKSNNDAYRSGWDAIFGNKVKPINELTADERLEFTYSWWRYCQRYASTLDVTPQFEEWYLTKSMEPDPPPLSASSGNSDVYDY